jgi:hypothetical protein
LNYIICPQEPHGKRQPFLVCTRTVFGAKKEQKRKKKNKALFEVKPIELKNSPIHYLAT